MTPYYRPDPSNPNADEAKPGVGGTILCGDVLLILKTLPDESVQCCVTSPPYWGLRDYGVEGQLGLEKTPDEYVQKMVEVFREVKRVLKKDGTLWLNLGDSYAGSWGAMSHAIDGKAKRSGSNGRPVTTDAPGLKPKDLVGIPWRVAFALQADGWWLRQDIIWCLSGGTWLYVRSQKGDMPMMLRDAARLKPETVRVWTGQQWTRVVSWTKSERSGDELEIVLRSGERISCTPNHYFPTTERPDCIPARILMPGMVLVREKLPEPAVRRDSTQIGDDVAWLVGLYIAEGSRSEDTIQITGHAKEHHRLHRIKQIAEMYGGTATCTIKRNTQNIRIYGKILNAIIDQFVSGRTAKDKCLSAVCWQYSNRWLDHLLMGYLAGDGHWDVKNKRWRLGFTRNYNLERDLRTLSARLGFRLILNQSSVKYKGKKRPTFRGEIRFNTYTEKKSPDEIVEIRKARCREVYDVAVEDAPHLFALASGVMTHNSKPNPMPESVTDRCTKAHEYIFLLTKSAKYYYDAEAVKEPITDSTGVRLLQNIDKQAGSDRIPGKTNGRMKAVGRKNFTPDQGGGGTSFVGHSGYTKADGTSSLAANRNLRSVWTITTKPFTGAHFATFPPEIPERCIKAGTKPGDVVLDTFAGAGTTLWVAKRLGREYIGIELNEKYVKELIEPRLADVDPLFARKEQEGDKT